METKEPITIDEFITAESSRLESFKQYAKANLESKKTPSDWVDWYFDYLNGLIE